MAGQGDGAGGRQRALVTGATSGMGRAIVQRLASDGFLVAAVAPDMAARGGGCIISISSMAARIGLAPAAAYGATKGALEAMTRAWAAEFSPHGVRVNAVAPGPVYTDGSVPERITALGASTPMGRAASPAEIVGLVSFLASPQASYITGAMLAADGGRTAV